MIAIILYWIPQHRTVQFLTASYTVYQHRTLINVGKKQLVRVTDTRLYFLPLINIQITGESHKSLSVISAPAQYTFFSFWLFWNEPLLYTFSSKGQKLKHVIKLTAQLRGFAYFCTFPISTNLWYRNSTTAGKAYKTHNFDNSHIQFSLFLIYCTMFSLSCSGHAQAPEVAKPIPIWHRTGDWNQLEGEGRIIWDQVWKGPGYVSSWQLTEARSGSRLNVGSEKESHPAYRILKPTYLQVWDLGKTFQSWKLLKVGPPLLLLLAYAPRGRGKDRCWSMWVIWKRLIMT